ncbi:DUF2332 domain-containing protein [Actinoalloteichus sp. GBA129-24]|uniref:DUF2332 domain-containing protein n=2 Tax=Actinoalloteichus fjordicus TaxID=1612552 RepID=A0AAC9PQE9_9PSEU|nr:DUF2332 domain-containing protein [Actinoalloteichus sp. GBA129-24]APU13010.1 hypothetical protein UA74_04655 [Actinoalloteichus fjordicus]APU18983.1 hypothetical protein UA75_04770 [Actinoalloteichus sp. GBA129-24]
MLVELFRDAARACLPASPLTNLLLDSVADDLAESGPMTSVVCGLELGGAGSVPGLRFAAAVHHLVLSGRAPKLARHYPTAGGRLDPATFWPAARAAILAGSDGVRERATATAVQTNEPGRMAPCLGGLQVAAQEAARRVGRSTPFPIRLLEIGASGGLNLRPDRVALELDGTVVGDETSPLRLDPAWTGRPSADLSAELRIVERAGCDLHPSDPNTEEGRLHLSSFVWPDSLERWDRLQAALRLASTDPITVDRAAGPEWLADRLADLPADVLTVVWHSVVWQYVSARDRARGREILAEAAARATDRAPLALLVYESRRMPPGAPMPYRFDLLLRLWPSGLAGRLGTGGGHGIPFTWLG